MPVPGSRTDPEDSGSRTSSTTRIIPIAQSPYIRRAESLGRLFGIDLRRTAQSTAWLPRFRRDRHEFLRQAEAATESFPMGRLFPCLGDDVETAGVATGGYFHQDLYVAQRIHARSPVRHLDVGSRIDGFVAHVASFRAIEVVDIRPLRTSAGRITFLQRDVMTPDSLPENYADSVSCLNVLEHFGLGRYGDPVDFTGHRRGFDNLVRVCAPGGLLYLAVPIGPLRVEFNGHRVFSVEYVLSMAASHGLRPEHFAFIDDTGELHADVGIEAAGVALDFGCQHGCGLFEFRVPA